MYVAPNFKKDFCSEPSKSTRALRNLSKFFRYFSSESFIIFHNVILAFIIERREE